MKNIRHPYAKVCTRHEEEFRFRETRDKDILLTVYRNRNCVVLETYSRKHGKRGRFYVNHDNLYAWIVKVSGDFFDTDCGNILRIRYDAETRELYFDIYWLSEGLNGGLSGVHQTFTVDGDKFVWGMESTEPVRILCKERVAPTTFIWHDSARQNLRWIAQDKLYRRALCKAFGNDVLRWPGETIQMYADGGRDFYFRASSGIDGGLICSHGTTRNGYQRLKYSTHT